MFDNDDAMETEEGVLLNDTLNWNTFSESFVSTGQEEYIVIGHFKPDSETVYEQFQPVLGIPRKGAYYFIDEVQLYKCSDTITPILPEPILPNVFTPNMYGSNALYKINNLPDNSRLEVYNRWGELVFNESPYQNLWQGQSNGNALAEGVYFVILSYKDQNGNSKQLKETVHLFR